MGEALHEIVREREGTRCRIYAPVGAHRDLLAYLVRRLLENGANSSFVNQIVDKRLAPEVIAADPLAAVEALGDAIANPRIRRPEALFAPRRNARGWNVNEPASIAALVAAREAWRHASLAGRAERPGTGGAARRGAEPGRPGRRGRRGARGDGGATWRRRWPRRRRLRRLVGAAGGGAGRRCCGGRRTSTRRTRRS